MFCKIIIYFTGCPDKDAVKSFEVKIIATSSSTSVFVTHGNEPINNLSVHIPSTLSYTVRVPASVPPVEWRMNNEIHTGDKNRTTYCIEEVTYDTEGIHHLNISLRYASIYHGYKRITLACSNGKLTVSHSTDILVVFMKD